MKKILSYLFFIYFISSYSQGIVENDRNALLALYNSTDGANWSTPWDLQADESTWAGVTINNAGRVTNLRLSSRNLNGTLPIEIGNLTELTEFNIFGRSSASLTGSIPASICNLTKLEKFSINQTDLTGEIPSCLFSIVTLQDVFISGSSPIFTLNLPDDLSGLVNLEELYLQRVDLSSEGGFPQNILQLTNLKELTLDINRLTGTIPLEISNLTKLTSLGIAGSNITGTIPSEIGLLTNLKSLRLTNNRLSGTIPNEIGNLINLESLSIGGNDVEGEIPNSFENLVKLRSLSLSRTNLSGSIPNFLTTFTDLGTIKLDRNNFSGTLPFFSILVQSNGPNTRPFLTFDDNNFVFEDFENDFASYQANLEVFFYAPQSNIDIEETITFRQGEEINLTVDATQSINNEYQWQKDGVAIIGATERNFTISEATAADEGKYDCIITNSVVNDLSLLKNPITLKIDTNPVLSIDDQVLENSISFYPNPTNNFITLNSGKTPLSKIVISDINGHTLKTLFLDKLTEKQISLENFSSGIYYARIISSDNLESIKVFVKY